MRNEKFSKSEQLLSITIDNDLQLWVINKLIML